MAVLNYQLTGVLPQDAVGVPIQVPPTGVLIDNLALSAAISNMALTSNVVTITTVATHNYHVGQKVTVLLLTGQTLFADCNGTFLITGVNAGAKTFTYSLVHANIVTLAATGSTTVYNVSPMPTDTYEMTFVFPAKSFQLIVVPLDATDATMSYTSGGGIAGSFPLFQNVSNAICGTEGDTVYIQRTTTTRIAFIFSVGR